MLPSFQSTPVSHGSNPVEVSVIVPVYRRADWLLKNLSALDRQIFSEAFEVIVVDDGSPNENEIWEVVDSFYKESNLNLRFFRTPNGGPAVARNWGVKMSYGAIICFLDDDSVAEPAWLAEIVRPFADDPRVGLVSGRTCSYYRDEKLPVLLEKTVYAGKCWATCNIAYRRGAFEEVGGFDETFLEPSWEDNDLGLRVKWAGFSHVFGDLAVVLHPHERSLDEYRRKCLQNGRGLAIFTKKYWRSKPLWGIGGPVVMSRRLLWALHPNVWFGRVETHAFVRFTWSWYSLKGFCKVLFA